MDKELEYYDFMERKREKIHYMHTIIKNNIYKDYEIDILLRGYIILIYSFWESSYNNLWEVFYYFLSKVKTADLPFRIRNEILLNKIVNIRKFDQKINELKTFNYITKANKGIESALNKVVDDINDTEECFKKSSNNPNIEILCDFLKLYNMKLETEDLIKRKIGFLVEARNDIAHRGETEKDYKLEIQSKFNDIKKSEIDILQDITLDISELFRTVIFEFKKKYSMHKQ